MDEINETLIAMAAENYADSLERRGCAFWQGLYRGYIAGYRAREGKETSDELGDCNMPRVIKSEAAVCPACGSSNFVFTFKPFYSKCFNCGVERQTVL